MAWRTPPLPPDETQRRDALRELGWLGAPAEGLNGQVPVAALRALAASARTLCGADVGVISLVDSDLTWQVLVTGPAEDDSITRLVPRARVLCALVVAGQQWLHLPDLHADPRCAEMAARGDLAGLRCYVGVPLRVAGQVVGALAVGHASVGGLSAQAREPLQQLAVAVESLLDTQHARACLGREAQRLADLARASGDWLWELDGDLRLRWLSADFERLCGVAPGNLLGLPLQDEPCVDSLGEPLSPPQTLRARLSGMPPQPLKRVVSRLFTARGLRYVSRSAVPVVDDDGLLLGWRGSARDVTSQVLADRQTRDRDGRQRVLLEQLPGAAFQLRLRVNGSQPHFLYLNQGLRELLGQPLADDDAPAVARLPLWQRVPKADRRALARALRAALRELRPMHVEHGFWRLDGQLRWLETRATPQAQADGRVVLHGFTWDVTQRRAAQDTLREHEQLRQSRDLAEGASRAKSELLSRVSHELRTPLHAVLGFADLMALDEQQPLRGMQRNRLQGMRQSAQTLLTLVDEVLELSRIERGEVALRHEAVPLAALLRQCLQVAQPLAFTHAVRLQLDEPGDAAVWGDAAALQQVLGNLLDNAIKFNRAGGSVRLSVQALASERLALHVDDDGQGLDAQQLDRLFQPFDRLDAARRRIEGAGLGLVLARALARAMGGDVLASSQPGQGSRFSVLLAAAPGPAVATVARLPGLADPATATAPVAQAQPASRVVLYIEDEPLNVLLMEEVFRTRPGWTLHVAYDGASGVQLAREQRPQLVLIDMNLPDMGGLEVLRRLRADAGTAELPCVALSADAMQEQIAAARAAGFEDYWTKPIDLTRLLDDVRALIDHHTGQA